jgi:hypothetical protein
MLAKSHFTTLRWNLCSRFPRTILVRAQDACRLRKRSTVIKQGIESAKGKTHGFKSMQRTSITALTNTELIWTAEN